MESGDKPAFSKDSSPFSENVPCGNQDSIDAEYARSQLVEKFFIIIASTKSLEEAYDIARKAEHKTGFKFQDSRVEVDTVNGGLTFPPDTCKTSGFDYPCYVPRGRYDDGIYFSIESSNNYDGFTKDFYIIIAGSGSNENDELKTTLTKIKRYYPDCYIKKSKIYMGCIH